MKKIALITLVFFVGLCQTALLAADRPNILWIVSEDNSPFLGCFGDKNANTPNLDALAKEGVRYPNAFANFPVCAPARNTIIHGIYANSLGNHNMRSTYHSPEEFKLFPYYLAKAGYFCSNHSKTDYNRGNIGETGWTKAKDQYRSREEGQPFFCIINLGTSHESSLHRVSFNQEYADAKRIPLPPYHPNLPEVRSDWEHYYRILTRLDAQIGEILERLEKDGLADDTIVFYYGDHGGILTRSKRFLYESGTRVPMIIRFPKKYEKLASAKPGEICKRLVSFVDLAPTVLSLTGIDIPKEMQGKAFLGSEKTPTPEYVYLARGRMDERAEMQRAVRDAKFRYIRNYNPHTKLGKHVNYLWKMATTRAWEKAYLEGKCNEVQSRFFKPYKEPEELYDVAADPWEVNNLAKDPKYADVLKRMRKANQDHILEIRDAGFMPEPMMIARPHAAGMTAYDYCHDNKLYPLERILATAEMATSRDASQLPKLIKAMGDEDAAVRYWAALGCSVLSQDEKKLSGAAAALTKLLKDKSPMVRLAAAEALYRIGEKETATKAIVALAKGENHTRLKLYVSNVIEESQMGDAVIDQCLEGLKSDPEGYVQRTIEYILERRGIKPPAKEKKKNKSKDAKEKKRKK